MRKLSRIAALVAFCLVLAGAPPVAAEQPSADDTAKFIAGMMPSADSGLAAFTQERAWQQHAATMNKAFATVDAKQLAPIHEWVSANLKTPHPAMFYMFSGPDFLYANAFFPDATTYVLAALEPVGAIPDLSKSTRGNAVAGLGHLENSMRSLLSLSFFITKEMRENLGEGAMGGTLPILYVFLARSGKQIRDVHLVALNEQGELTVDPDRKMKSAAHGVKIVFTAGDARERTLYYFTTNLANDGAKTSGFLKFCEKLGPADSFIKSASYLLHHGEFSHIRDFLLERSAAILQDDSGVPLRYFDETKWTLQPFGRYLGPLSIFPEGRQPKIAELFKAKSPGKLNFGVGYQWRAGDSNLLLATRAAPPAQ